MQSESTMGEPSISNPHPHKRKPVETDLDAAELQGPETYDPGSSKIHRSPELWFEDGTIVLQSEGTQFRVHRSVLSRHSSFFEEMFGIPQPMEGIQEDTVEGCSVVSVFDRAQDWEHLLKEIYSLNKFYRIPKDYPVPVLVSMLRLGHKYEFNNCRDTAMQWLKAIIPTSIDGWDSRDEGMRKCTHQYEFDLANIATEVGLRTILPVTYLLCLKDQGTTNVMNGIVREDGTISRLSLDIQRKLTIAREAILTNTFSLLLLKPLSTGERRSMGCRNPKSPICFSGQSNFTHDFTTKALENIGFGFEAPKALQKLAMTCCTPCNDRMWSKISDGRVKLWDLLPQMFELPRWRDLSDSQVSPTVVK